MMNSNPTDVVRLVGAYSKAFPVQSRIDPEGLAIYGAVLSQYDIKLTERALNKIIRESKYFPSIAEIIEAINKLQEHIETAGKGKMTAGEAWEEALKVVARHGIFTDRWKFSTPELERTVKRFGMQSLLMLEIKDEGTAKAQFRKIFEEEQRRDRERNTNNEVLGKMSTVLVRLTDNNNSKMQMLSNNA